MFRGECLSYLRKQNNMTQEDLAKKLDLKRATISNMEVDRISPPLKTLEMLAKTFNVSIYYFLDTEDKDKKNKFPFIIPKKFHDKDDCMEYLSNREGLKNLYLEKLTDEELIDFANEIQNYIEILSYKYKKD
ncbi:helix-turn-helix transcriptional regulator [Clostridium estertheticum]|uniref:helix-turn-helix domain-containing protein n=1 Tax=Clostridium estertheticum TaxID=238834 RepID=UPI001CF34ACD|nr:helix-turn-helix transcriptional regulator [Clostridium estertheticum]MCB2309259.1 helix-turn-helix transcriptional regulator [Clostridium estertheticum]MCB2346792.1 helix-turn-helix transcriptional regulator [Clostridium estertheticum]MCB2352230.1 helix-turn-helix transcriptional regulator [Clostridium estertheticum]WAG48565.1 helix-turn-helix transcriptional regulator [Clostridium estertheticum]